MLTHNSRWSHAPGNTVVPSRWQATPGEATCPSGPAAHSANAAVTFYPHRVTVTGLAEDCPDILGMSFDRPAVPSPPPTPSALA